MFNIFCFSKKIIYLDYWKQDQVKKPDTYDETIEEKREKPPKFVMNNPGDCTNYTNYGFNKGKPCVLVKMNKVK
jgi:hypothetical protein